MNAFSKYGSRVRAVKIDSYKNKIPVGTPQNPNPSEDKRFVSLTQLLLSKEGNIMAEMRRFTALFLALVVLMGLPGLNVLADDDTAMGQIENSGEQTTAPTTEPARAKALAYKGDDGGGDSPTAYDWFVTYDGNGGEMKDGKTAVVETGAGTIDGGIDAGVMCTIKDYEFTREGHTFAGWQDEDGNKYSVGERIVLYSTASTLVLKARWEPETVGVTVTKTFTGVSALPAGFAIAVTDSEGETLQTLTVADASSSENGAYTWTVSLPFGQTYAFTETGYEFGGYYTVTPSVVAADGTEGTDSVSLKLDSPAYTDGAAVAFTNAYVYSAPYYPPDPTEPPDPGPEEPGVIIDPDETPLDAATPAAGEDDAGEIPPDDIPLDASPKTGESSPMTAVLLLLLGLSACGMALAFVSSLSKRKD